MKSSRSKKSGHAARRKPRFSKATPVASQKKQQASTRKSVVKKRAAGRKKKAQKAPYQGKDGLPGWDDLVARKNERVSGHGAGGALLEAIPTTRLALLILAIAAAFTLYVGHVHATQTLLADVQEIRRDNLRLHLKYNRLKGEFDRATGPAVIYGRAKALGLVEEGGRGPTIYLK